MRQIKLTYRIIKFRAWDKLKKVMIIPWELSLRHDDIMDFMQFTGLKDKQGREIYEGDILADRQNGTNKLILTREVVFDEFGVTTDPGSGYEIVRGWGMKDMYDIENIDNELEVIGNVWETPELTNLKE